MKKVPEDLATKLYRSGDQLLAQGDDVRMEQVAEDLGVARATLYYYFSGKDDLITFLMQEKMERIATEVQKARAGEGTALERFEAAMRAAVYELASNPALCLNMIRATGRMEAMAEILASSERAIMAPLRELLIEARAVGDVDVADIDLTIAALMGGTNMAVLSRWALTGEVDPDDMSQSAVTLFLNGVRTRRSALASRRTTATTTNGKEA